MSKYRELGEDEALMRSLMQSSSLAPLTYQSRCNEVGFIFRIKNIDRVDTLKQELEVSASTLIYKFFDAETDQDFIAEVKKARNGSICSWHVAEQRIPPVRMNWAGDPKLEWQMAWITQLDDWKRIRMVWEQTFTATFKNPTSCAAFPFDWLKFKFQVWLEPSIGLPSGILRGTVYENDPLRVKRKAELLAVSMKSDPVFPTWSYYNDEQETIVRTSSFCSDNRLVPEWEFFTYRDLDCEGTSSWPYWLATQASDGRGFNTELIFTLWARRRPGFYVKGVLLCVVLTEIMVLLSFVNPRRDLHERQSWNMSLLLVLTVIKFASRSTVPSAPYLTMYEKKHVSAWVLIFVVMTMQHLSVIVDGLDSNILTEKCRVVVDHFEAVCMLVALTWFLAQNVWYWTRAYFLTTTLPTDGVGNLDNLMRSFGNEACSDTSLAHPLMNQAQKWGTNHTTQRPTHRVRGVKA